MAGMVAGASLIPTAEALWREAIKCSGFDHHASENTPPDAGAPGAVKRARRSDGTRLERAIRCLYAGLELVLPVQFEIRFRLLLARILQAYTMNSVEACEHLRKALVLVQSVPCSLVRIMHASCWCSHEMASSDKKQSKLIAEARKDAIKAKLVDWWMHFDWLAWQRSQRHLLEESLDLLELQITSREEITRCRLYLHFLLAYFEPALIISKLEPLVLDSALDDLADGTPLLVAANACIQQRMERGDTPQARAIFEKCARLVSRCKGMLPGNLEIPEERLQNSWAKTMALISLRIGEAPNDTVKKLQPEMYRAFQMLTGPPSSSAPRGPYSQTYWRLMELMPRTSTNADTTFAECQALGNQDCPNLESLRMLIMAMSQYHLRHPAHQVKASLLAALKILNGTTQNAQMKIVVLLLLGQLYLDTDFAMSVKMNSAAYSFACTAEWHTLAHLASQGLSRGFHLLGKTKEAEEFAAAAAAHLTHQLQ